MAGQQPIIPPPPDIPPPPTMPPPMANAAPSMLQYELSPNLAGEPGLAASIARGGQTAQKGLEHGSQLFANALTRMGVPPEIAGLPAAAANTAGEWYLPKNRLSAQTLPLQFLGLPGMGKVLPEGAALLKAKFPSILGEETPISNALEAGSNMASKAGDAIKSVTDKIPNPWNMAKAGVSGALQKAGELYSGIRPAAFKTLEDSPEAVLAAARKGMTTIPETGKSVAVAMQDAQQSGRTIQDAIENIAEGAGKKYQGMLDFLKKAPEDSKGFDVGRHVGREMHDYINVRTPYMDPELSTAGMADRKVFMDFYKRAANNHDMSPGKVADYLQDITSTIRKEKGTPLSAHLSQLKDTVLDSLPGEYSHPSVMDAPLGPSNAWDIKGTRDEYRMAKELQRNLKSLGNKDNSVSAVERALNEGGKTAENIRVLAAKSPEVQQALDAMRIGHAGADFAPKLGLTRATGLTGAALLGAGAATHNPIIAAQLPFQIAGSSPRLLANTLVGGGKAAKAIEAGVPAVAKGLLTNSAASPLINMAGGQPQSVQNQISAWLRMGNAINPSKSGEYGPQLKAMNLPGMVSGGGTKSIQDVAERYGLSENDVLKIIAGGKK